MTAAVAIFALLLLAVLVARPGILRSRGGKILAFLAFLVLPVAATSLGTAEHLEHSKTTEFCLSCHEMEPYGASLHLEDPGYLPASHAQNNRVPRATACFACHTSYTLYGDFEAKIRGVRHVWVHYLGEIPEEIELYEPYSNRECLYCHERSRTFIEQELHAEVQAELAAEEISCLECHDMVHPVDEIDQLETWEGAP